MNFKKFKGTALILPLLCIAVTLSGCKIKYSFTGGSISPDAKTFSVSYFPNNAAMVSPLLSPTLTDALQEKFTKQTRLTQRREGGDLHMEGEITGYSSVASAVSADEYATLNRLSITVRVRFTNAVEPQYNFDKAFTQYADYDSNKLLQEVEGTLIPEIVDMLVEDIFNAATSNW